MTNRSRTLRVVLVLFALFFFFASPGLSTSARAASPSVPLAPEQMRSAPEPEEPPADEPQADEEVIEEEVEGIDVEEEVTPPPLEPPPAPPAPSTEPAPPVTTPPVVVVPPPAPPADAAGVVDLEPPLLPPVLAPGQPSEPPQAAPAELSSKLRKICARLGASPLAKDPTTADYLARMNSGRATADEMNDFGVLLARKTYLLDAEAFVEAAVSRDKKNTDYWLNLGTVRLQRGKLSSALVAYEKALKLDPNKALTHYNIGVVHDYMQNYNHAVDSFTRALAIDPSLGDPKVNPLAVNNDRLLVVNLLLYQAKEGGLAMPLSGGPVITPPAPRPTESKKSGS